MACASSQLNGITSNGPRSTVSATESRSALACVAESIASAKIPGSGSALAQPTQRASFPEYAIAERATKTRMKAATRSNPCRLSHIAANVRKEREEGALQQQEM